MEDLIQFISDFVHKNENAIIGGVVALSFYIGARLTGYYKIGNWNNLEKKKDDKK